MARLVPIAGSIANTHSHATKLANATDFLQLYLSNISAQAGRPPPDMGIVGRKARALAKFMLMGGCACAKIGSHGSSTNSLPLSDNRNDNKQKKHVK